MNRTLAGVCLVALLFGLPSVLRAQARPSWPDPDPAALYAYVIKPSAPYTGWKLLRGTTARHKDSAASHDTLLTTRVNATAYEYLATIELQFDPDNALKLPVGSVLVKENYSTGHDDPASLQVMYKPPADKPCGYPECQNGWFFANYTLPYKPSSKPVPQGSCIACHTNATVKNESEYYESAGYMLSLSDYVWGLFYEMVKNGD